MEAAELLLVEVGVFGEGHHSALNADGLAGSQITDERSCLVVGHADSADAGVNADMEGDAFLRFGRDLVEGRTKRRVDHGHDAAGGGICEILLVERAEEEEGLANAGVVQRDGFMEFDHSEAEDFRLRFEDLGDVCDAHAVAVVFDDREDGTRSGAAGHFLDIVSQIFTVNLNPGIERRIF